MSTHQICLVSAQAAANLLPALDSDLQPDQVILLVSQKMQPRSESLAAVMHEAGVKTRQVALENEHDYSRLVDQLIELAAELEGSRVALNVTGGTKLMALAAQEVARGWGWDIFYVDADTGEAIWLTEPRRRQPLKQQLRLRHYLKGYGFSIANGLRQPKVNPGYQDLLCTLVTQLGSMSKPLGQLNWLAQRAENNNTLSSPLTEKQYDSRSLETMLRNFEHAGLLKVDSGNVVFTGEWERDFVKGGWLEQWVFRTLAGLGKELGIRDKACNLEVIDAGGVKNELDVVFLARNRLHVIECKTAQMEGGRAPRANDTLFKLAEIARRVGGLATRTMLVSYRKLGPAERKLAGTLRIEVVCAGALQQLEARMRNWVTG